MNGNGTLTVNSGAVASIGTGEVIAGGFSGGLTLGNGEGVITVASGDALTGSAGITVSGAGADDFIKTGAGTLTLAGVNSISGPSM